MGCFYGQLSLEERVEIYRLRSCGLSLRKIGTALGRSASTISRELRRNSKATKVWRGGYCPLRAAKLAQRRRVWDKRFKMSRQPRLRALVRGYLVMGWSPQQIAGRLAQRKEALSISYESIYRYVYYRTAHKDYWHQLLPRRKYKRGLRSRVPLKPHYRIPGRVGIEDRPNRIGERKEPGHWEADMMLFSKLRQQVLVLQERVSRYVHLAKPPNRKAGRIAHDIGVKLEPLPRGLRRTLTLDNGSEFAWHYLLRDGLGLATYFCDPSAPWQKGSVENAIGRLRKWLPRKTDIITLTNEDIMEIQNAYNTTPRKCLGYKTPKEVYDKINKNVALQT